MKYGLLGKKIGMTRVYDEKGKVTPVTVVDVSGNALLQVKTVEKDGYSAIQLGFDSQKASRVNKAQMGRFTKAGSEPKRFTAEFRLAATEKVDGELNLNANLFQAGQVVDVIGHSKGKGFAARSTATGTGPQNLGSGYTYRMWKGMGGGGGTFDGSDDDGEAGGGGCDWARSGPGSHRWPAISTAAIIRYRRVSGVRLLFCCGLS